MANARSIIEQALRKLHVVGRGQSIGASEAQNALTALNSLISSFNAEGGVVTNQSRETFPLDGSESFSIGQGGDFNTDVPTEIIGIVVNSGDIDYPLKQIPAGQYQKIAYKDVGSIPEYYYYDNNRPLGNIFLWPRGDASYTLDMITFKSLNSFADLTTDYNLAEGVERMLVHNLCVEMAPEYEREAARSIVTIAMKSKQAVISRNRRFNYPKSSMDAALIDDDEYDIYEGSFV